MRVTKLTVVSHTGKNKRPHGGWVWFDDGKCYYWGYGYEERPEGGFQISEKILLTGSKKLSLGSTQRTFYSEKRDIAIKNYFENNY